MRLTCPRCLRKERRANVVIHAAGITACSNCFTKLIEEEEDPVKMARMIEACLSALEKHVDRELSLLHGDMGDGLYRRLSGKRTAQKISNKY